MPSSEAVQQSAGTPSSLPLLECWRSLCWSSREESCLLAVSCLRIGAAHGLHSCCRHVMPPVTCQAMQMLVMIKVKYRLAHCSCVLCLHVRHAHYISMQTCLWPCCALMTCQVSRTWYVHQHGWLSCTCIGVKHAVRMVTTLSTSLATCSWVSQSCVYMHCCRVHQRLVDLGLLDLTSRLHSAISSVE